MYKAEFFLKHLNTMVFKVKLGLWFISNKGSCKQIIMYFFNTHIFKSILDHITSHFPITNKKSFRRNLAFPYLFDHILQSINRNLLRHIILHHILNKILFNLLLFRLLKRNLEKYTFSRPFIKQN